MICRFFDRMVLVIVNIIVLLTMTMNFERLAFTKDYKNFLFFILLLIAFINIFGKLIISRNINLNISFMDISLLIMVLFVFSSLLVNMNFSLTAFYNALMCFIVYFYFKTISNESFDYYRWVDIECVFSILFLIVYLMLFFTHVVFLPGQRTSMGLVLPFLALTIQTSQKSGLVYSFLGLFIFTALISMNRTFFIVALFFLIVKSFKTSNKLWIPIIAVISYLFVYYGYDYILSTYNIDILRKSLDGDITSGRLYIYENVLTHIKQENFFDLLIGKGFNGVAQAIGIGAHSDFLETFYDYGIIAFGSYLCFLFNMFRENKNLKNSMYILETILVIYSFTNNMLYSTGLSIPLFMAIGITSNRKVNCKTV